MVIDEWTPEGRHLSPSLKLRRKFIASKYVEVISEIYGHDKPEKDHVEKQKAPLSV